MALIEEYHVVADSLTIDASVTNMIAGMFGMFNSTGNIVIATGAASTRAIGVSADTKSTSVSGLPATNSSSQGAFVNRVSDSYDETKASGRVTLYHAGGRFASNQYVAAPVATYTPGCALYVSSGGLLTPDASANAQVVATCVAVPAAFPSGVPGIDITGSLTLGNYIDFILLV